MRRYVFATYRQQLFSSYSSREIPPDLFTNQPTGRVFAIYFISHRPLYQTLHIPKLCIQRFHPTKTKVQLQKITSVPKKTLINYSAIRLPVSDIKGREVLYRHILRGGSVCEIFTIIDPIPPLQTVVWYNINMSQPVPSDLYIMQRKVISLTSSTIDQSRSCRSFEN